MPAALLAAAAGVAVPAGSASAADEPADVAVEITAKRNVLPADGWSDIEVYVRNDGAAPAAGVTVTLTLPPQLRAFTSESTSDWECDWASPVLSCTHVGDFAPGESTRVIRRTVEVQEVASGDELAVSTSVTTSSPEASTGNNTASRVIRIVDTGEIRGRLWNDLNADGVRQAGEPAATSVGLSIRSQDDEDQYGFSNNHDGTYRESVPVKRFKVLTELYRFNWRFTTPDVGGDDTDSDLRPVLETSDSQYGETPVFMVEPATPTVVDPGVFAAARRGRGRVRRHRAQVRATAAPTITGTLAVGSTVKATPGSWTPAVSSYAYQWSANGAVMRGATHPSLPITAAMLGQRLKVTVTAQRAVSSPGVATSPESAAIVKGKAAKATKKPSITGTAKVGRTVGAAVGTWSPKADSSVGLATKIFLASGSASVTSMATRSPSSPPLPLPGRTPCGCVAPRVQGADCDHLGAAEIRNPAVHGFLIESLIEVAALGASPLSRRHAGWPVGYRNRSTEPPQPRLGSDSWAVRRTYVLNGSAPQRRPSVRRRLVRDAMRVRRKRCTAASGVAP